MDELINQFVEEFFKTHETKDGWDCVKLLMDKYNLNEATAFCAVRKYLSKNVWKI